MKRICALALVLFLLIPGAWAAELRVPGVFSIEYPDDWLDYGGEGEYAEDCYELSFICGPLATDPNLNVHAAYYPEFARLRLFDADEATIADYAEWIADGHLRGELIEIRRAGEDAIPFVLLRLEDSQGEFLTASTFANGWMLDFQLYAYADARFEESRAMGDADLEILRAMLDSFEALAG